MRSPLRRQAKTPLRREGLPVSIGRIDLARGNVNFSDLFVRPNYSANLTDVAGSVSALSAGQAGDVAITARVDHSAPVEVQGRIHPFAQELVARPRRQGARHRPAAAHALLGEIRRLRHREGQAHVRRALPASRTASSPRRIAWSSTSSRSASASRVPPRPSCRCCSPSRCSRTARGVIDIQLPIYGLARRSAVLGRRR